MGVSTGRRVSGCRERDCNSPARRPPGTRLAGGQARESAGELLLLRDQLVGREAVVVAAEDAVRLDRAILLGEIVAIVRREQHEMALQALPAAPAKVAERPGLLELAVAAGEGAVEDAVDAALFAQPAHPRHRCDVALQPP